MSSNNRTDKDIEAEAKVAINEVIKLHRGMAAQKIRPELRKAFPFGPSASAKERKIWEDTMKLAMEELSKWPIPVLIVLLLALPCSAQVSTQEQPGLQPHMVTINTKPTLKERAKKAAKTFAKYTGLSWTNKHVVKPTVDKLDEFGTKHQGLITVCGAVFGAGTNALIGAGAARK